MAHFDFAPELRMIPGEDGEIARISILVYADESAVRPRSPQQLSPFFDWHQADRVHTVREKHHQNFIELPFGSIEIICERTRRWLFVKDHPERG